MASPPGRSPYPAGRVRSRVCHVRLTVVESDDLKAAAARRSLTVGELVRASLTQCGHIGKVA